MANVYELVYNCILFLHDLPEGKPTQSGVMVSQYCISEMKIFLISSVHALS